MIYYLGIFITIDANGGENSPVTFLIGQFLIL